MKPLIYSKNEWMIMFIILPPIAVGINFVLYGFRYFSELRVLLLATLATLGILILIYISCGMVAGIMQYRFPKYSQTFKRIGISLVILTLITVAGITIIFLGYDYIHFLDYEINWNHFAWLLVIGIFSNLLATSLNEGAAFYEKWRLLVDEAENLKKENLQSQLEGLKGQVNPHFLFNSLNSLSSLIAEDPEKAEEFIDEMSKVYRYMLRSNEDGLTSLKNEMLFIQSYFHMLKTRYSDGLELKTIIDERYLKYMLPPLTLQMLVENAVKHNVIQKDCPLNILIMTTNSGKLVVTNNLQRKSTKILSNKIGLTNISNKYRLMKQEEIMVNDDGKEFSVVIPLINN